jgi:hypothetical protein
MVARGEPVGDADGEVGVGVVKGVKVASGVGVGVGLGVGVGTGSGVGVGVGLGVAVASGVGVEVASGVGVGVCTRGADGPQLTVRKPIRRRKSARRQLSRFRSIMENPIKTR